MGEDKEERQRKDQQVVGWQSKEVEEEEEEEEEEKHEEREKDLQEQESTVSLQAWPEGERLTAPPSQHQIRSVLAPREHTCQRVQSTARRRGRGSNSSSDSHLHGHCHWHQHRHLAST